ncbi:alkaline serine protease [Bacillus cereus]|uniref:Alkaline serine protease n=1 Tax=Bacillus cereus TaxID=1396 RepID=A0A2B1IDY1_BACCE|nr:S8 family peptidase [Bacillus cereus]PFC71116.1 alkaline serine protease [Bacillus cereus]PFM97138.1 alkaline serine protease [Bacillus cereus]
MKKLKILLSLLFFLGIQQNTYADIIEKNADYLITFNTTIDEETISSNGGKIKETFPNLSMVKAEFPYNPNNVLIHNKKIKRVEKDEIVKAQDVQQISFNSETTHKNQDMKSEFTGKGVSVAVLDTGIDEDHQDLIIKDGISFVENHPDFDDDNGHGTHLAGIIAAQDNNIGTTGLAPNVDLYAVKVLDSESNGKYSTVVKGIDWAIEHKINIVLMSLGGTKKSLFFEEAMNKAYEKGVLLISSAGNKGFREGDTITYPANFESVIAVGALDNDDQRGFLSSRGENLELMAPGVDILSTWNNGDYKYDSGTSMAAAHVAGAASLIFEKNPYLSNKKVREIMNKTAISLGDVFEYGNGKININAALDLEY